MPPETSVYGDDPDRVFQELVSLLYDNSNCDATLLVGDYNARVGARKDVIEIIDDIPDRTVLDLQHNDHGISLVNFLLQSNTCIINGRINPLGDSYTSISHRGKAVVDYVLASHDTFNLIQNFEVLNISELMLKYRLMEHCVGLLSDHSVMRVSVKCCDTDGMSKDVNEESVNTRSSRTDHSHVNTHSHHTPLPCKFKLSKTPDDFMYTHSTVEACSEIIDKLLRNKIEQEELNSLYEQYVEIYYTEMGNFFKELNHTPHSKKALNHSPKPYWTELSELWKTYHSAEKVFVK